MAYPPNDEILDAASMAGDTVVEIRVGANRMREFCEWARPFIASHTSSGESKSYDGIPVVEVHTNDSRRAYVNQRGDLLVLE